MLYHSLLQKLKKAKTKVAIDTEHEDNVDTVEPEVNSGKPNSVATEPN